MPFFLERDTKHSSIKCLHCDQSFYINWEGEPYSGTFKKDCLNCSKELEIEVEITMNYYVSIFFKD